MLRKQITDTARLQLLTKIQEILRPYGFVETEDGNFSLGDRWFQIESDEFVVTAGQDRAGDVVGLCVGSKKRRIPRAYMRGPWSLSHLRGYLDGNAARFMLVDAED